MNWTEHNVIQNGDIVSVLPWQDFDWLVQGFSLAKAGNIDHRFGDVTQSRKDLSRVLGVDSCAWTSMQQVHGNHVEVVIKGDIGAGFFNYESGYANTDGLVSRKKGALLSVAVADCVPLLFVDPVNRQVAVAHAGRRGSFAEVAKKVLYCAVQNGSSVEDIQVAIGPSIGPCCYMYNNEPLDLWSINEQQLREAGVTTIIRTNICTKHTNFFFSHQRDPKSGRFAGLIGIR